MSRRKPMLFSVFVWNTIYLLAKRGEPDKKEHTAFWMWVFCHNRIHFKCMLKYDFVAEESIASKFTMFVMLCVFVQKTVSNQTNKSFHIFVSSLKTPTFFTCFSFLYFDVFLHHLDFTHTHFVHTRIENIYWILFDSIHIFFSFFLSLFVIDW